MSSTLKLLFIALLGLTHFSMQAQLQAVWTNRFRSDPGLNNADTFSDMVISVGVPSVTLQ